MSDNVNDEKRTFKNRGQKKKKKSVITLMSMKKNN